MYFSPDITKEMEARRILRVVCVARIGQILQTFNILVGNHRKNKPLGRLVGLYFLKPWPS